MDEKSKPSLRGETTRDALLNAAILVFARKGFEGANLREIAEAAEVNQALIGYHFHSKEGLYLAVFLQMTGHMRLVLDPGLEEIGHLLDEPPGQGPDQAKRCLEGLLKMVDGVLLHFIHENPSWGELIVREQQAPTAAFDLLFENVIGPAQRTLTNLILRIRASEDLEKARLICAMVMAQVLMIRNFRTPILRLMRWEAIGERELTALRAIIRRNTTLLVTGD